MHVCIWFAGFKLHDNCNLIWQMDLSGQLGPFVRVPAPTQTSSDGPDIKFVHGFPIWLAARGWSSLKNILLSIQVKTSYDSPSALGDCMSFCKNVTNQ